MATAVKMPQLGVTMTEAKVVRWLKAPGDRVQLGEPVAEIETDKLNTEVAAAVDGVLRRVVAPEGAVVAVAGLLAVIGEASEPDSAIEALIGGGAAVGSRRQGAGGATPPFAHVASAHIDGGSPTTVGSASTETIRATPLAKRLAADHRLDLAAVRGSGPGGRVTETDVRAAIPATTTAGPASTATDGFVRASPLARRLARESNLELGTIRGSGPDGRVLERDVTAVAPVVAGVTALEPRRGQTIRVDGMRRLIGDRMLQSLRDSAQLTLTTEADATALVELRAHLVPAARVYGHRPPTYTDLLVHLVARILPAHPLLNSSLVGEGPAQEIACWADINIGVAVALDRGLVVPVVRQADQKSLDTISAELGDLVERARASAVPNASPNALSKALPHALPHSLPHALSMDDLQGGTFTITNLGAMEIDGFTPIINPPQCAILGVGRIIKKPTIYQDQIVARQLLTLSLTVDHRIVDGAPAGAFLRDVKRAIEGAGEATWLTG